MTMASAMAVPRRTHTLVPPDRRVQSWSLQEPTVPDYLSVGHVPALAPRPEFRTQRQTLRIPQRGID